MGFSFPLKKAGKYLINLTYFQDPSNINEKWAKDKKALNMAKKISVFKTVVKEEIIVK